MAEPFGELRPYEPSWRDKLAGLMSRLTGDDRVGYQRAQKLAGIADFVPGIGTGLAVDDTARALGAGDYLGAGFSAMGVIPGAGKLAGKAGKEVAEEGVEELAALMAKGKRAATSAERARAAERGGEQVVERPPQERSGVFDYDVRYPPRDLGVERYRPPRGVPERTTETLARPEVFDRMLAGVERGKPVADWYETGPLRKSFEDQFGPERGLRQFDQFIDAVAATSPRSDVGTNVRNASFYYGKAQPFPGQNSIPSIEDLPEKNPFPYGHLAQNLHRLNAAKTVFPGGGGLDFKANAKPIAFAANLKGDPTVATIDTHAFRAPAMLSGDPRFLERSFLSEKGATPRNIFDEAMAGDVSMREAQGRGAFWQSKPMPTEYGAFEDFYKKLGQEAGLTPAETQAAGWVGHGPMTGLESAPKSFMDFIEERILKTAAERGMDPREVWRMAMTGKMPLLSLGGGAAAGAAILPALEERLNEQ